MPPTALPQSASLGRREDSNLRRTHAVARVALLALLALSGGPASLVEAQPLPHALATAASEPALPAAGLSSHDVQRALERIGAGDGLSAASLLAGLDPDPAPLPGAIAAPPPLASTLQALARASPGAGLAPGSVRAPALPPEIDRALSALGQGALAATTAARAGDALGGARALDAAIREARPGIERASVLLSRERAFLAPAADEPSTRDLLRALATATTPEAALAALPAPAAAPPAAPVPLSESLARLYLRLGLPAGFEERAALAIADTLDPDLRLPLETALVHVLEALRLRDEAYAALHEDALADLADATRLLRAVDDLDALPASLDALSAYADAIDAIDAGALARAAGELDAARRVLTGLPPGAMLDPYRPGDLAVRASSPGPGDVELRASEEPGAPGIRFEAATWAFDPDTGSFTIRDDAGPLFRSAPLADPRRDVLFQDPFGLVVVTGERGTLADEEGGRAVRVRADGPAFEAPAATGAPATALATIDARLRDAETHGAWAYLARGASDASAYANETPSAAPREVEIVVNPAGYHVLRWDLGGDDEHRANAAGAGERGLLRARGDGAAGALAPNATRAPLPVSLLVDLAGNDTYATTERATIAGANASLAMLWDAAGDDAYRLEANATRGIAHASSGGIAVLVDLAGNDTFDAGESAIGHSETGGVALLVDAAGRDSYAAGEDALAASRLGRLAAVLDLAGDDALAYGNFSAGASAGGVAVLLDREGNDRHAARERGTSQGFVTRHDALPIECPAPGACPRALGPARLAIAADFAGDDLGLCAEGSVANAAVGSVGVARAPASLAPFDPSFGLCADLDLAPAAKPALMRAAVPLTFFASSFGNFTIPGLARLGTLGDDVVVEPFLLSVDLAGNDTYAVGAVAVLNATRAAKLSLDLGYVGPASVLVDAGGANVFDRALAPSSVAGAFGYADGGVAAHVTWGRAVAPRAQPPSGNASLDENATRLRGTPTPRDANVYRNASVGLAMAEHGGVALLLAEGVASRYESVQLAAGAFTCRLACARTGGVALALAKSERGDDVHATPGSLGAVIESPLGGVAVYAKRGGLDRYFGSNESMGVIRANATGILPGELERAALGGAVAGRPRVALFVDDGWDRDEYATSMRRPGLAKMPRANDRSWEADDTASAFAVFGNRTLFVAQGYDDLDWFLQSRLARADEGVAAGQGPATSPPVVSLPLYGGLLVPTPGAGTTGTASGPEGLRPVTLARTIFTPGLEVPEWSANGNAFKPLATLGYATSNLYLAARTFDPVGYADASALGWRSWDDPERLVTEIGPDEPVREQGASIHRVDVRVQGLSERWRGCAIDAWADPLDPDACIVASWVRGVDPVAGNATMLRPGATEASETTRYVGLFQSGASATRSANVYAFPPGPYLVTVRAFAARPYGLPAPEVSPAHPLAASAASDAVNYTDDQHGLFGATFNMRLNVFQTPSPLGAFNVENEAGAKRGLNVSAILGEPMRYRWAIHASSFADGSKVPTTPIVRFPTSLAAWGDRAAWPTTASAASGEPYGSTGFEEILLSWNAKLADGSLAKEGKYSLRITLNGTLSSIEREQDPIPFFVDREAPPLGVDPRLMPSTRVLNATTAPGGRFNVTLGADPDVFFSPPDVLIPARPANGSNVARAHLWVHESILDPSDPSRTLQEGEWTFNGTYDVRATSNWPQRSLYLVDDESVLGWENSTFDPTLVFGGRDYHALAFQGDPHRGAPRLYRFAAYVEDRAGNVRAPATTIPEAPDCVDASRQQVVKDNPANYTVIETLTLCAEFLYDVTPPRTKLSLVDPAPVLARSRSGNVTLAVDASETPDVRRVDLYVGVGNETGAPPLASFTRVERPLGAGGNLRWTPGASQLASGDVLYFLARGVDHVGNVEPKGAYDLRVAIDRDPPALRARAQVASRSFAAMVLWETSEPTTDTVVLLNASGSELARFAPPASEPATSHELEIPGLEPQRAYAVTIESVDEVGNAARHAPVAFTTPAPLDVTLDALPPLVAAPVDVTWRVGEARAARVTYNVSLSLDGGASWAPLGAPRRVVETGNATRAAALDPGPWNESTRARVRLEAWPTDAPGAVTTLLTPTFTLDAVAPRSTVAADAGLAAWTNASATIAFSAVDGASGVARVEASGDNVTFGTVATPLVLTEAKRLWHRAVDVAGNVEIARSIDVRVDREAPSLALGTVPSATRATVLPVRVRAGDELAGVASVEATDGVTRFTLGPDAFSRGEATLLWKLPARDGPRALDVVARDAAGNSATARVETRVDRTPPFGVAVLVDAAASAARVRVLSAEPARLEAALAGPGARARAADETGFATSRILDFRGLSPSSRYILDGRLFDAAGNAREVTLAFDTLADTTPPAPVSALSATSTRHGAIALRWSPARDDVGVAAYRVERDGIAIANVAETFLVDEGTKPGWSYHYRVVAFDAAGNRATLAAAASAVSRTAPVLSNVSARAENGRLHVTADLRDPDLDAANATLVVGGERVPMHAAPHGPGAWRLDAFASLASAALGAGERGYHVEAVDGAFFDRAPFAGEARLPDVVDARARARGLLAAAREIDALPAPIAILALAALAALASARRRRA